MPILCKSLIHTYIGEMLLQNVDTLQINHKQVNSRIVYLTRVVLKNIENIEKKIKQKVNEIKSVSIITNNNNNTSHV